MKNGRYIVRNYIRYTTVYNSNSRINRGPGWSQAYFTSNVVYIPENSYNANVRTMLDENAPRALQQFMQDSESAVHIDICPY